MPENLTRMIWALDTSPSGWFATLVSQTKAKASEMFEWCVQNPEVIACVAKEALAGNWQQLAIDIVRLWEAQHTGPGPI